MTRWCWRPARSIGCCRCFRPGSRGIHYLRIEAEALALREELARSRAAARGRRRADRPRGGGLGGRARHQDHRDRDRAAHPGARLRRGDLGVHPGAPRRARGRHPPRHRDRRRCARCRTAASRSRRKAGDTFTADLVVVGTGVVPDDRLAKAAGLDDAGRHRGRRPLLHLRSRRSWRRATARAFPDPRGPVRLENWRHAQEHGAVAGRNAAGGDATYNIDALVLVGAIRPLHPGHGLAAAAAERAGAPADRPQRHAAVRSRRRSHLPTCSASMRSATSRRRAA